MAELARRTDLSTVSWHYGLNWKTVGRSIRRVVAWGLAKRRRRPLHILGIDEVSPKKGHKYLTVVYDLERGQGAWIGQDRRRETVHRFFDGLGKQRARIIEAVTMDRWAPSLDVVREQAPQAEVCFDRFHVVRHLNAAVDEVRRSLVRKLKGPSQALVKGTRFVRLKNPWNRTPKQKRSLRERVRTHRPLSRAWYRKEDFQRFWDYVSEGGAKRHLDQWLWWARPSRLEPFKDFARMIPQAQGRHPGLDETPDYQRRTGRRQQQDQTRQSPKLWLPKRRPLHRGDLSQLQRTAPAAGLIAAHTRCAFGRGALFLAVYDSSEYM